MSTYKERFNDLHSAVREFLSDWRKGDFELPKIAQIDAKAMEESILKHLDFSLTYKDKHGRQSLCYVNVKSKRSVERIAKRHGWEVVKIEKRV